MDAPSSPVLFTVISGKCLGHPVLGLGPVLGHPHPGAVVVKGVVVRMCWEGGEAGGQLGGAVEVLQALSPLRLFHY